MTFEQMVHGGSAVADRRSLQPRRWDFSGWLRPGLVTFTGQRCRTALRHRRLSRLHFGQSPGRVLGACAALFTVAFAALPAVAKPSRIVSLNLCTDQILIDLVPTSRIAALTTLAADRNVSAIADRVAGIKLIAGGAEEVLALNPDLILASPFSATPTVDLLRRLGRRIEKVPFATDFANIIATVRQVAAAVAEAPRGEEIIAKLEAAIKSTRPPQARQPSALVYQVNGLVSGPGSLADAALQAAGLTNQANPHSSRAGARMPLESIAAMPPDLVVLAQGMNTYRTVVSDNLRHPALAQVMARRSGVELPMPLWLCGSPRIIDAVDILAAARAGLHAAGLAPR